MKVHNISFPSLNLACQVVFVVLLSFFCIPKKDKLDKFKATYIAYARVYCIPWNEVFQNMIYIFIGMKRN